MRAVMPWLEDSDAPACRAWAELEVLASRVYAELRDRGVISHKGEARSILDDYRRLRATQIILARELGMTTASRMAIRADGTRAAVDLATALANHRAGGSLTSAPDENIGSNGLTTHGSDARNSDQPEEHPSRALPLEEPTSKEGD